MIPTLAVPFPEMRNVALLLYAAELPLEIRECAATMSERPIVYLALISKLFSYVIDPGGNGSG